MRIKFAAAISTLLAVASFCPSLGQQPQSAQPPATQAPLRVDGDVMAAKLVHDVFPYYPQIAVMAHVSGVILLHVIIATDGTIRAITFVSGPELLRNAAMATVHQWRFEPTLLNGQPVEVDTTLSIHFDCCGPEFTIKADTADAGSSRAMLTESVETMDAGKKQNWASFLAAFEDATSRAWLNAIPSSAGDKKGKVSVEFDMRRDGTIDGVLWLTHSSHDSAIDDTAKLTMRKCAPFQGVPVDFPYPTVNFRVTFSYDHPHPITASTGAPK